MKFCKDCKWHHPDVETFRNHSQAAEQFAVCNNPVFINGGSGRSDRFVSIERKTPWPFYKCGEKAKLFEAKEVL